MISEDLIRIGEAAKLLGLTTQTLRNWEASGKLVPVRSKTGQRLYDRVEIGHLKYNFEDLGWAWASSGQIPELPDDYYCERQDRFSSRLEKMASILLEKLGQDSEGLVSLVTAIAGEIGDNSFAHNLGNWPDVPGIFFAYDPFEKSIVIADRGRGVKNTLQPVRPTDTDTEALEVAFTEIVSGRSPEQRGNGLKFVRQTSKANGIDLIFRSGLGVVEIRKDRGSQMRISSTDQYLRGVYAVIKF